MSNPNNKGNAPVTRLTTVMGTASASSQDAFSATSSRRTRYPEEDGNSLSFWAMLSLLDDLPMGEATATLSTSEPTRQGAVGKAEDKKTERSAASESKPKETAPASTEPPKSLPESATRLFSGEDTDWLTFDATQLTRQDLSILQQLPQVPVMVMQSVMHRNLPELSQLAGVHYTSLGVSKGLQDMLEQAYKAQRPVRVDLSDSASVILRLGRDGMVSAEFLAADQAAEMMLRQQVSELKSRLAAKQLPYGELLVKENPHKRQQKDQPD